MHFRIINKYQDYIVERRFLWIFWKTISIHPTLQLAEQSLLKTKKSFKYYSLKNYLTILYRN